MDTIPIFFTFDRNFVLAAGVAFYTLLENASKKYSYHLYVVHTDLTKKDEVRLKKIVHSFSNVELSFKNTRDYDTAWNKLRNKSHFSKEIFYKMTAASMFPEYDRILFSDVDVIFKGDISESYSLFPNEKFYFAGTRPILENTNLPGYQREFNSEEINIISKYEISAGYMLINLKCIREDNKEKQLTSFFYKNIDRLRLPEQDCIALCCAPNIRFLDYKYVVCGFQFYVDTTKCEFNSNNPTLANRKQAMKIYSAMLENVVQLHYPGPDKPWNNPFVPKYNEWLKACKRSSLFYLYIMKQPHFFIQRLKRYSLRRFFQKINKRYFIKS